jgi:hypothetical protein
MHHHLLDDLPGATGRAAPYEGLLRAAGAMSVLCVLLFALLFVV